YLEDTNGGPLDVLKVKALRKTVRGALSNLVNAKLAPQTWGKLSSSGRDMFRNIVERAHPICRLDTDGWKLEHL
ncbi:hypothetical protein HYDPIDRAFT_75198, partial [Hydnomerulius pinastri MD-312]